MPLATESRRERYLLADDLCLDVGRQQLERKGREIPLPKLSFDFLLALVRAAPNVVTYDELMAQVWPGLVVQPDTITQRAKLVREALGDDSHAPKFVRGVRGRGYVLACGVQRFDAGTGTAWAVPEFGSTAAPAPTSALSSSLRRSGVVVTACALGIVALASTVVLMREGAFGTPAPHTAFTVQPFVALPGHATDLDVARGVTEAVHARLMARKDLASRPVETSAPFHAGLLKRFTSAQPDTPYVLKGSLQRADERLRVTVQLVAAQSGETIHSFIVESNARDILALEDDVALRAARAMRVESEARAAAQRPDPGTRNPLARLAFERGRARYQRWRIDDGETAVAHFKQSIALDPDYARAYAWQAMAEIRNAATYKREDGRKALERVQPLFERALALDPKLGEAYAIRAFHDFYESFDVSEAGVRDGIALEPTSAESWSLLAQRLGTDADKRQQRLDAIDRAIALSPQTTRYRYLKALFLWQDPATGTQGVDLALSLLGSDPDFAPAAARLARWRWFGSAQPADAVRWGEHSIRLDADTSWQRDDLCNVYLDLADPEAAHDVSDAAEPGAVYSCRAALALYEGDWQRAAQLVFHMPPHVIVSCDYRAGIVGALSRYARETGDSDRVLELLRQAYGEHYDKVSTDEPGMPERAFLLLEIYRMRGEQESERRLLDALWRWLPERERGPFRRGAYPLRAMLLAWSGRERDALDALAEWTRKGHSPFWWYVFEHDATWQHLRRDGRFVEALRREQDYISGQRATLATLRRQGVVPLRGTDRQMAAQAPRR